LQRSMPAPRMKSLRQHAPNTPRQSHKLHQPPFIRLAITDASLQPLSR
jgi:hypothetical protein